MLVVSVSTSQKSAFCFFAIVMIKGISYGNQVKVYACPSVTS